ncbi:MAG: NUDIX domain-containing protein [Candidatus Omnitrophica bacterium]|nr:NUDIX domain-containing protein [Candidatus Omnitrophota bacterium]
MMRAIPKKQYKHVLRLLPILCVDIIAQNARKEYLLIKRVNQPKINRWWVVGGRVHKGESLVEAARRKMKEETGLKLRDMKPVGYYELLSGTSPFQARNKNHTISVVFSSAIEDGSSIILDKQSCNYKFSKKLPGDFRIKSFKRGV